MIFDLALAARFVRVLLRVGLGEAELDGPDDGAKLARGEESGPERA